MANENLRKAKNTKNDEFYTQFNDIQKEINAYLDYDENVFKDKTILLPCDDPEWSNFTKFFVKNFQRFGIKKLISTSYAKNSKEKLYGQLDFFEDADFIKNSQNYDPDSNDFKGKIFTLENGDEKVDIDNLQWNYLTGDGDFRSEELKKLRDEADFIITNPPFSIFREFIAWLTESTKKFLIIGNMNAITYKEIFPLIKNNKLWLGNGFANGNAFFSIPKNSSFAYANGVYDKTTNLVKFRNCCWFTNIEHGKRHQPLQLMKKADNIKYNKKIAACPYPHYDNYAAIEVCATNGIPADYDGIMGVPISFLTKYCPDQFEIIGATESEGKGFSNGLWNESSKVSQPLISNKKAYKRIFIRKRQ